MTNPPSTLVVIEASGDSQVLARCLEGLLAGLGPRDRAVVLAADEVRARRAVRGRRSTTVEAHPGRALGDRLADWAKDHTHIVVAAEHALAAHRSWLTALLAASAAHPGTVIGPLTNGAPWPQCPPDAPDAAAPRREVVDLARHCGRTGGGATIAVGAISGPLALIDAATARTLAGSGVANRAEMAAALAAAGTTGRVALGCYVHTAVGVPLLSGCLIVKDEAADLADCLATIAAVVDEVVVYDTGSRDDTIAIARSLGAVVVEGAWHDDFSRARNDAMAAARGRWVLSIDADERLELAAGAEVNLRTLLSAEPAVDRYIIPLYDLLGSVHAPVRGADGKPMARLFRRRHCCWEGAIHEQPNARPGRPAVRSEWLGGVSFLHRGYLNEVVTEKDKWARNLRVATSAMTSVPDDAKECFDLGRSLHSMGYQTEALTLFDRAAELDDNPVITRAALQFLIQALLETGHHADAEDALARLRAVSETDHVARYLEGWLRVEQGRWTDVVAALDGLTDYNDSFTSYTEDRRLGALALAWRGLGERAAAAQAAAAALGHNCCSAHGWLVLLDTEDAVDGLLARTAEAIPLDQLAPTFVALRPFPVGARDRVADAVYVARPGDTTALAAASQFASELAPDRLVTWAGRFRAHGLVPLCPLLAVAEDGNRTVDERVRTLALALHELGGADLTPAFERLVGLVLDDALAPLAALVLDEAVGAAESFIVTAASTAVRALALVGPLAERGYLTEALAVVDHATGLDELEARRWADRHHDLVGRLRAAACELGREDRYPVLDLAA